MVYAKFLYICTPICGRKRRARRKQIQQKGN
jgi:hypothetical protein